MIAAAAAAMPAPLPAEASAESGPAQASGRANRGHAATQAEGAGGDAAAKAPARFAELIDTAADAPVATPPMDAAAEPDAAAPAESGLPERLLWLLADTLGIAASAEAPPPATVAASAPHGNAAASGPVQSRIGAGQPSPLPPAPTAAAGASTTIAEESAAPALPTASTATPATTGEAGASAIDALATGPDAAAALTQAAPAAPSVRPATAVPGPPLPMPANPEAGFDDGFGARIAWVAEQRLGQAEIRLNPEHIGPIEVRIRIDESRVWAEFHSAHAEVRQAIEASVPRLRELLGQQGLQLGHADVGQRAPQGQPATGNARPATDGGLEPGAETTPAARPVRSRGLLDEYA